MKRNGFKNQTPVVTLSTLQHCFLTCRRTLLRNTIVAGILLFGVARLLSPQFTAETVLLPPDVQEGSLLGTGLEKISILPFSLQPAASSSALFVEILSSRAVAVIVVHSPVIEGDSTMNLIKYWHLDSTTKAVEKLAKRARFHVSEQGLIRIEVDMEDPGLAASVATAFVSALDQINQNKSMSKARETRIFVERQREQTQQMLKQAADSLAWYQKNHNVISLEAQADALFEQASLLKRLIVEKRVALQVSRRYLKDGNPELIQTENELAALQMQFDNLKQTANGEVDTSNLIIPAVKLPDIVNRYAKLLRDVKSYESVWQYLTKQLYQSRIRESKDTPTIQVLDPAVPPEKPSWPRPFLMIFSGMTGAFTISFLYFFFLAVPSQPATNGSNRSVPGSTAGKFSADPHRHFQE